MRRLRNWMQHKLNAVHVFCRLQDCGLPQSWARRLSAVWEAIYKRPVILAMLVVLVLLVSCAGKASARHDHPEHWYQAQWCADAGGRMETHPQPGLRVDCETASHAVEFDFARKWAESVGQALAYAGATGKRAGIVLILEHANDTRYLDKLRFTIAAGNLPIDVWTMGAGVPAGGDDGR